MIQPAARTQKVEYAIRDILKKAEEAKAAGKQLLYLNIGDPMVFDYKTPTHMIEACYKAMLDNHTGYANSSGVQEARDAIGNSARRLSASDAWWNEPSLAPAYSILATRAAL